MPTTYSYQGSTSVSGTTVTFNVGVRASTPTSVSYLAIGIRNSSGANFDLSDANGGGTVVLPNDWWLTSTQTATLPAGTYTYGVVFKVGNTWSGENFTRTFTVGSTTGGGTTTPPVTTPPVSTTPTAPSTGVPTDTTVTTNGHTWTLLKTEDFTKNAAVGQIGNVYGQSWLGYPSGEDTNGGTGNWLPLEVLSASNSALHWDLHTNNSGQHAVAVSVPWDYYSQTYGRYSVRLKLGSNVSDSNYKIAFMLWPASDDWADGEIDWPEVVHLTDRPRPASKQLGNYDSVFSPATSTFAQSKLNDGNWHIATTEWTADAIRFYLDDVLVATVTDKAYIPTKPMRLTLQAETELWEGEPSNSETGTVDVDWIAMWKY